jgi:hypothetical protein
MSEIPPSQPLNKDGKPRKPRGRKAKKLIEFKQVKNNRKNVQRRTGPVSKWKARILDELSKGVDVPYTKGYCFKHSIHEALNKSGLVELLRELGVDGVKVLREDADRKQLTINKLEEKIHERDVIINRYRVQEHRFKKAPKISKELGGLPEDTIEIELVMCLNLIKQFRATQSKELYVNRLKFAIGCDPLSGLNSLLKSGGLTD